MDTEIPEITEIIDETTLMITKMIEITGTDKTETKMMIDDKTETEMTDMTKIMMTLGQGVVIMDESRGIKSKEEITTIDDEMKEIKMRDVIEAITHKGNIMTSMLTGDKITEIVVTMVKDTIGMMTAQILETITPDMVKDTIGTMIAQIIETTTTTPPDMVKDMIGMMIAQTPETITPDMVKETIGMITDDN